MSIAISRVRASTQARYKGVILVNPGGPGFGGNAFVEGSASALRRFFPGFDFIGFDPRGVGESSQLGCKLREDPASAFAEQGVSGTLGVLQRESQRCAQEDGALFQRVGSNQVVQDLDRIRGELGVEQINFLGISYGTRLAALYAQTFPEHARAFVLDAPLAPTVDYIAQVQGQFEALLAAHRAFFQRCANGTLACPPGAEGLFDQLLKALDEVDLREQFLAGWALSLSSPTGRDALVQVLQAVAADGAEPVAEPSLETMGAELLASANLVANVTTNCADSSVPPPDPSEAESLLATFQAQSQLFAVSRGLPALNCIGWEVERDPVPELSFASATPVLVIGGVEDSLAPLMWAEQTAQALPGSRLLVSEHYGHGATEFGSLCVFEVVRRYFDTLELPPPGTRCGAP